MIAVRTGPEPRFRHVVSAVPVAAKVDGHVRLFGRLNIYSSMSAEA